MLGKLWGNAGYIQNVPSFPVSWRCPCSVPRVYPKFTESGSPWAEFQGHSECATQEHFGAIILVCFEFYRPEHCDHTAGNIAKEILNEPLGYFLGTFFGKILDVPMVFLMGTSRSHDLEHCKCTGHFLTQGLGTFQMNCSGKFWVFSLGNF